MSISEKLKNVRRKAKKAVLTGALAMAAVTAPVKGQSAETEPTAKDAITAVASKDAMRQKMFESAVRANLPREEIAKYVDFPEFMPVNKNGQLDEKQVQKLLHDPVTNHIDSVKKFYHAIAATHHYSGGMCMGDSGSRNSDKKGFYKALETFITEISGSKEGIPELMKKIAENQNDDWTKMADKTDSKYVVGNFDQSTGMGGPAFPATFFGGMSVLAGIGLTLLALKEKEEKTAKVGLALLTVGALGVAYGVKSVKDTNRILDERFSDPKDAIVFLQDGVKQVYDNYLDGTIQTEKDRQTAMAKAQFNQQAKDFKAAQRK